MAALMDLIAGDRREILLGLAIDDFDGFADTSRFPAHLPLGGGLDPTWLDLFSRRFAAIAEADEPRDFLDACLDLPGGPLAGERTAELVDPVWVTGSGRRSPRVARRDHGALDRSHRGRSRHPLGRREAVDPRAGRRAGAVRPRGPARAGRGLRLVDLSSGPTRGRGRRCASARLRRLGRLRCARLRGQAAADLGSATPGPARRARRPTRSTRRARRRAARMDERDGPMGAAPR